MKNKILIILVLLYSLNGAAQQPNDLLVYSVKGKVLVMRAADSSKALPVKIGSVLHNGDRINTEKNATLTMLCNQGKTIVLNKEGNFAVKKWKDSCKTQQNSLSSSYFRFIWGQMYSYSPENIAAHHPKSDLAVVRGEQPDDMVTAGTKPATLSFSKGMDTVVYFNQLDNFPLSWTAGNYSGKFIFRLYNEKGTKLLYKDTLRTSFIPIGRFLDKMMPGKNYRWSVSMKKGNPSKKRVLKYKAGTAEAEKFIAGLRLPDGVEEDSATASFRVAYMLEQRHYLEPALLWYERANAAAPDNELFRDQLTRFRNEFWIR